MSSYTLDDIRAELDVKYAPVVIDVGGDELKLRPVLRLPKEDRSVVFRIMKTTEDNEMESAEDLDAMLATLIELLTVVSEGHRAALVESLVGDDLALALKLMELYNGSTQPGEASSSPA
jgi:hypothetical protein